MQRYTYYLTHSGVKGMEWGKHKFAKPYVKKGRTNRQMSEAEKFAEGKKVASSLLSTPTSFKDPKLDGVQSNSDLEKQMQEHEEYENEKRRTENENLRAETFSKISILISNIRAGRGNILRQIDELNSLLESVGLSSVSIDDLRGEHKSVR